MNEKKLIRLGKISQAIAQIFRYTVILLLLTIAGVGTAGIAGVLGVLYFKFVQKIIPFKISVHNDFLDVLEQKINLEGLKKRFKKKLNYNILIFGIVTIIAYLILSEVTNPEDLIFFSILFGAFISLSLFQFYYFKSIHKFIHLFPEGNVKKSSLIQPS